MASAEEFRRACAALQPAMNHLMNLADLNGNVQQIEPTAAVPDDLHGDMLSNIQADLEGMNEDLTAFKDKITEKFNIELEGLNKRVKYLEESSRAQFEQLKMQVEELGAAKEANESTIARQQVSIAGQQFSIDRQQTSIQDLGTDLHKFMRETLCETAQVMPRSSGTLGREPGEPEEDLYSATPRQAADSATATANASATASAITVQKKQVGIADSSNATKRLASERHSATFHAEETATHKTPRRDDREPSKTPNALRRRPASADLKKQASLDSMNSRSSSRAGGQIHQDLMGAHDVTMTELDSSPSAQVVLSRFPFRPQKLSEPFLFGSQESAAPAVPANPVKVEPQQLRRTSRIPKEKQFPGYVVDKSNSRRVKTE